MAPAPYGAPQRLLVVTMLVLAWALSGVSPAQAQNDPLLPQSAPVPESSEPPPGFGVSAREARRIADSLPAVREQRREHPDMHATIGVPTYGDGSPRFEVTYFTVGKGDIYGTDIRAAVILSGVNGLPIEIWTGPQAGTPLARGYEPPVGRSLNQPYIWLPLAALFLLPFFDFRRPFRLIHLDLLVLLGFGLSQLWFNRGEIAVSVPLVYPLLVYLLVRLLLAGFRPRQRDEPLLPHVPPRWLAVGLLALVALRIGMNIVDSHVIDVGYASVVGADRIAHGEELYVLNAVHGDTYGPLNYLAYVPFEALFPVGAWTDVPAAHAAAIFFDLVTMLGLFLLGGRLRRGTAGRTLGLALAFAWAAYPFSLYALQANTNDALVSALVVLALVAAGSAPVRGAFLGLAAAAKFAPLALAPLLASGTGEERRTRSWPAFGLTFVAVCVLSVAAFLPDGGLREFYDTTIGFQLGRTSPFSLWGLHPSLGWLHTILQLFALALAVVVAFLPRRRDLRQVVALAGAITIATQLTASHWFYFYLVWLAPLVLATVHGAYATAAPTEMSAATPERREAAAEEPVAA